MTFGREKVNWKRAVDISGPLAINDYLIHYLNPSTGYEISAEDKIQILSRNTVQNGGDKGTVKIKNSFKTHLQNYFFNLQGIRVHTLSFSVSQKRDRLASL